MGLSLRIFVVEDDGALTPVPLATFQRWYRGQPLPASRAGSELKLFEVAVEVERRHVVNVFRILPYRLRVHRDGRLDTQLLGRQAIRRLSLSMAESAGVAEAIEALEADANYFWAPSEKHVEHLARAVFRRSVTDREVRALCELVFRPGARRNGS